MNTLDAQRTAAAFGDIEVSCALSTESYRLLALLLEQRAGIVLGDQRRAMAGARLARRARELGYSDVESYATRIASFDDIELSHVVDALTTHHTYFFRELEHFAALGGALGRELLARVSEVRCFSVACSTGEELYSAAMVLNHLATYSGWRGRLSYVGLDVSRPAVLHARRGVYYADMVREVPAEFRCRYLERSVQRPELVRIVAGLRTGAVFEQGNLLDLSLRDAAEVLFCRNLLIYFSEAQRQCAVERLWRAVAPGGYLVLGLTESLRDLPNGCTAVGRSVYRKCGGGPLD